MAEQQLPTNFTLIFNTFLKYIPSRFLVILNSIIIVPFFAYILSEREMGIYQLVIGTLNLLCTCSTDWIAKSALRFYERYKLQNKLPEFFSNILFISITTYMLILILYLFSANFISEKYSIPKDLLFMTVILIIPCGLRQFLYQLLRIFNKPFLYTFSIIIYQFSHLLLFLVLFNIFGNLKSILISMTIAMLIIDIYIIHNIPLESKVKVSFDKEIIKESLSYSLPTIFTNVCIWMLMHINQFVFQDMQMFNYTAITGLSWAYTTYILTPLLSTFLFAVFPLIIKKYEYHKMINNITTNTIQLYCIMFIPMVSTFIFYSNEITNAMFDEKYKSAAIIIPFFALTIFLHELMKIVNTKYHLKNRTYIETLITLFSGFLCIYLNLTLIPMWKLWGAGLAMIISILTLITLNSLVNFNSLDFIFPTKIFKTCALTSFICILTFSLIHLSIGRIIEGKLAILKVILFIALTYSVLWNKKNKILI